MKKFLISIGLAAAVALPALAQGIFYSTPLLNTNQVFTNGAITLVNSNFDLTQDWFSTKGINANDQNSTGYTFEIVAAPVQTNGVGGFAASTNSIVTNFVMTFGLYLDDYLTSVKGSTNFAVPQTGLVPCATNFQFSVTNVIGLGSNWQSYVVTIPATNSLGCKKFKLLSVNYAGTNMLDVYYARGGFWE